MRGLIQALSFMLLNSNVVGWLTGRIYKGPIKQFCAPGLNCYSCPGAITSCPVGAFQALLGKTKYTLGLYAAGWVLFLGGLSGRWICGWVCPFGWVQDLLGKLRRAKAHLPIWTLYGPYVVLVLLVIIGPIVTAGIGPGDPTFCKWLCPSGTLFGGFPLLLMQPGLRQAAGGLFLWKTAILIALLGAAVIWYRPFCRTLCPLGAVLGLLNKHAVFRHTVNTAACSGCQECSLVCPVDLNVVETPNDPQCIRCGKCRQVCGAGAIVLRMERTVRSEFNTS